MSTSQSIQGLIKWSQRGEWRDNFETALERHVGPACRSAGIGLDELAEIIGDHWMSTLWGCVFEDLVSAGRAERNVADDYLKRRGWKESAGTRAYIEALRRSSMSLYEVSDIVGGVSFLARDLVRGGGPVRVFERSATRSLSQWDRIAARVVTVLGKTQITGSVLPFSHQLAQEALASIERVRKKARAEAVKLARSLGRNVDDSAFGLVAGVDEVLAGSAFMFSNLWLDDVLRRALNPSLPHMQNTDGEPLEFITVHFPLVSNSNSRAIRAALDDLPPPRKEGDAFWNWVEEKALHRKFAKGQRPIPGPSARRWTTAPSTHGECGHVVGQLGSPGRSRADTVGTGSHGARARSPYRAADRRTDDGIAARPVECAGRPSSSTQRRAPHHSPRPLGSLPPDLGRADPESRQSVAAQGGEDRERSGEGDRLVKMLENHSAQQGRDDAVGNYDFTWIWKELGLGDERQ
jgi:hypothetical protein